MTTATDRKKDVIFPLSLVVVSSLLQAVLPSSEALEKFLLSYLKNKWLMWELRVSIGVLAVLTAYRAYLKYSEKKASSEIIKSYMETTHKIEIDSYKTNIVALGRELASKGLNGGGTAIARNKDLKLSHVHTFVDCCLNYIASTKENYYLDKPSVKSLLTEYKNTDISDTTTIITNQYNAKKLTINQSVLSSAISDIENAYSVALLKIDAM